VKGGAVFQGDGKINCSLKRQKPGANCFMAEGRNAFFRIWQPFGETIRAWGNGALWGAQGGLHSCSLPQSPPGLTLPGQRSRVLSF